MKEPSKVKNPDPGASPGRKPLGLSVWILIGLGSLALAGPARLELGGKAQVTRSDGSTQSYNRSGGVTLNLNLEAGDRVCVLEGKGQLSYGVKVYTLSPSGTSCFEVARPKSFWDSLVASCQDIGVCKKEAEKAFVKEAKSRGAEGSIPVLYLPADYRLPTLSLPISGGESLRLLSASGKEILTLRSEAQGAFVLPTERLRGASRLEVRNPSGVVLYAAPIRWVRLEGQAAPDSLYEAALSLWLTQEVSYAPAAYSYLVAGGNLELAQTLEAQIRSEFKGSIP